MQIFKEKTGKFVGLNADQLAKLNADQRRAYDGVADAATRLDAANEEFVAARDLHQASVLQLREAEAAAAKQRKWTAHDEWKASIAAGQGLPREEDLLKQAVAACQAAGEELTQGNLLAKLPAGFSLEIESDDSLPTLFDLQEKVSESHVRLRVADERLRECRGRLSQCIATWQASFGGQSFEGLVRQHIEQQNAERAARVASGQQHVSGGRPGKSAIDQFAFYTKASGRRTGGGRAFARGGVSHSQLMALRARAAAAMKQ